MPRLLFDPKDHPEITFDDVFLVPNNPVLEAVLAHATEDEREVLKSLATLSESSANEICDAETRERARVHHQEFRSVLLSLAEKYDAAPQISRDAADVTPPGGLAKTPVVIANMNNVSGKRMAEAIARVGGIATIPQDKSNKEVQEIIQYLRTCHPVYETPVTVQMHTKIHEFHRLLQKRDHDTATVVDAQGRFAGVLSPSDIPDGINVDREVEEFVRHKQVVRGKDGTTPREAIDLMHRKHVHYLPIVNGGREVVGALPRYVAASRLRYQPNIDEQSGGLRAAFTVSALNRDPLDRVRFLLDLGVRDLQFDTAHFDQGIQGYRNVEQTVSLAEQRGVKINLIAGNVVTRSAVRDILATGAKFVKVGIGPGAMCTTRMETGVGRPQVSAILECADEAHAQGAYVIADGGIVHPRDVAVAIAAGADYVMAGSIFAPVYESPPDLEWDEHGFYKIIYGMASARAAMLRTLGKQRRSDIEVFRDIVGHRSEGISDGRVYQKPGQESAAKIHHRIVDGLASSMLYARAKNIPEFHRNAQIGVQTRSGFMEGTPKHKL